ncbi:hypothetical protein J2Y48_004810 [Mycoplana sp. BE70]|nr:hypothetical protein [Mycoplana sp. BE70]
MTKHDRNLVPAGAEQAMDGTTTEGETSGATDSQVQTEE